MNNVVTTGVIPAAGIARRASGIHYSSILPKVLFPIAGIPSIEFQIYNLKRLGAKRIIVIINKQDSITGKYLAKLDDRGCEFEIMVQEGFKGLGGAIMCARKIVDSPFGVILGDDITISPNLEDMPNCFLKSQSIASQAYVKESRQNKIRQSCGMKLDSDDMVLSIVEKPLREHFDHRGIGIYIFRSEIFDFMTSTKQHKGEYRLTDTLSLLASNSKLSGFHLIGHNFNINTIEDFVEAETFMCRHFSKNGFADLLPRSK